jgi:hypothetical protein
MKTAYSFTVVVSLMVPGLMSGADAMANTYTTGFPLMENPISESGMWINGQADGLLWANCRTTNNFVWGNDNRGVAYADPTALLRGIWGSNQTVAATVKVINQPTGSGCCSEVELRLRSMISANTNRGYEVLFSTYAGNDYVQIVTWHGPRGVEGVGFDYVASTSGRGAPVNGDVVSASISNSTIRVYKNNVLILAGVNTEWPGGNPGVGFYGDTTPNVGFSRFTATDGHGASSTASPDCSGYEWASQRFLRNRAQPKLHDSAENQPRCDELGRAYQFHEYGLNLPIQHADYQHSAFGVFPRPGTLSTCFPFPAVTARRRLLWLDTKTVVQTCG